MKKEKKQALLLILLFIVGIGGTSLWSLTKPAQVFSAPEKRYLAKKPKLSTEAVFSGSYAKDYENYISDQFPGRLFLTKLQTDLERLGGRKEVNGVYFGKEDYLIEHHERRDFFSQKAEENRGKLYRILEQAQKYEFANQTLLFVPSAEAVLRSKLPALAPPAAEEAWATQIRQRISEKFPQVIQPALEEDLKEASETKDVYYRSDHHWNLYGSYIGYQSWAKSRGLQAYAWEDYEKEAVKTDFYGSVSAKVRTERKPDTLYLPIPKAPQEYEVLYNEQGTPTDSFYVYSHLKSLEPYAVYLNGNQPITEITQKNPSEAVRGKKLLLFKDSFGNSLAPFLAPHFEKITMLDLRCRGIDLEKYFQQEHFTDLLILYNRKQFCTTDLFIE